VRRKRTVIQRRKTTGAVYRVLKNPGPAAGRVFIDDAFETVFHVLRRDFSPCPREKASLSWKKTSVRSERYRTCRLPIYPAFGQRRHPYSVVVGLHQRVIYLVQAHIMDWFFAKQDQGWHGQTFIVMKYLLGCFFASFAQEAKTREQAINILSSVKKNSANLIL